MESVSSSLSLNTELVDSWSLWVTVDPRVRIEGVGASRTSVTAGLYTAVVGLTVEDVRAVLFPLRGTVIAKDVVVANAEIALPGFGSVLIEQLLKNNVLICSRYCPLSCLYGRAASERTPLGVAEMSVDALTHEENEHNWSLASDFLRGPSCRRFVPKSLRDHQIGDCLRTAYGCIDHKQRLPHGAFRRVVPSGGGIYPLRLAVRRFGHPEVFLCDPLSEKLIESGFMLPDEGMAQVFGQEGLDNASFIIMIFADLEMVGRKYGERAYRFCCLEAGHVGQNIVLWADRASLGALCLGGTDDQVLSELNEGIQHIYAIALGQPA